MRLQREVLVRYLDTVARRNSLAFVGKLLLLTEAIEVLDQRVAEHHVE
jgi:hypothetical protein